MSIQNLIEGHKKFRSELFKKEQRFKELAEKGQKPEVLWIGCSDSRVTAEFILGAKPGDLFVIRNIANIIPPQDSGEPCTGSVLEYAVDALKVKHIVICGHTECGGMKALLEGAESTGNSSISQWLNYALIAKEKVFSGKVDNDQKYMELIKENIHLQQEHLLTFNFIKEKYKQGKLAIHRWLYDIHTGKIYSYNHKDESWNELS
jgi:carbonic anhydrase